jgi:hypothetical protein
MEELKAKIQANIPIVTLIENQNLYKITNTHGETILHWLAITPGSNNLSALTHILTERLLHVNLENYRGTTGLYYSVISKNVEAVKVFLQYGANPRIRSGFSGQFPSDVSADCQKSAEIRELLLEFEKTWIPLNRQLKLIPSFSHITSYRYRKYMYILSNLNYFYSEKNDSIRIDPNAEELYKTEGIDGLGIYCDLLWDDFITSIKQPKIHCLHCENEDNLKRCSKCKAAYFCGTECQEKTYLIHKYDC